MNALPLVGKREILKDRNEFKIIYVSRCFSQKKRECKINKGKM